jgi:chromosome segregation ATPase
MTSLGDYVMDKTIWKRILESMPNEDFIRLTSACDINVKGFRKITPENFKMIKQKLLMEALKNNNLKRISILFDKKSEFLTLQDEDEIDFRTMTKEELLAAYEKGAELFEILGSLHSSSEAAHINLAIEFEKEISHKKIPDTTIEVETPEKSIDIENIGRELELARMRVLSAEKKLAKAQQKNVEWQNRYNQVEAELSSAKRNWKDEKKEFIRFKTSLQQEVVTKANLVKKVEEQIFELSNKIKQQEIELLDRNSKISHLNAKLLNSNGFQGISDNQEMITDESNAQNKIKIAIIGNPKNKRVVENNHFDIVVFEVSDIEHAIDTNAFDTFDEIWLLTYKVPTTKQKLVLERLKNTVLEISTFINLRAKVERG